MKSTCPPVEVFVVDDDAVAHAGEIQAVSEAVAPGLGIHVRLAGGRQRRARPGAQNINTKLTFHTRITDILHTQDCASEERRSRTIS